MSPKGFTSRASSLGLSGLSVKQRGPTKALYSSSPCGSCGQCQFFWANNREISGDGGHSSGASPAWQAAGWDPRSRATGPSLNWKMFMCQPNSLEWNEIQMWTKALNDCRLMCASVGMMQSKTEQWLFPSAALKKTYHAKSTQHACVREQDRKTQRENLKWELYSWQLVVPAYGQSTRSSVDSATRGTTQLPPHTALPWSPTLAPAH